MRTALTRPSAELVNAENEIAAVLSIVPGLGQVYKGHFTIGFVWMLFGMPLAIWIGVLLSLATAGLGLLVPIVCWAGLAVDAYYRRDLRKHHWFLPTSDGADEDDGFVD